MHATVTEHSATQPILACTDLTRDSEAALLTAAELAEKADAPLMVLHVAHDAGDHPEIYRRTKRSEEILPISELAERRLATFLQDLSDRHPSHMALIDAQPRVVSGLPRNRIIEVAHLADAQTIVLGCKGRGPFSKLLKGSLCDWVVQHSDITVQMVHACEPRANQRPSVINHGTPASAAPLAMG